MERRSYHTVGKPLPPFTPYKVVFRLEKVHYYDTACGLMIGVTDPLHDEEVYLGGTKHSFGLNLESGDVCYNGEKTKYLSEKIKEGDIITMNFPGNGSMEFLVNGKYCGVAFSNLPNCELFVKASVSCRRVAMEIIY